MRRVKPVKVKRLVCLTVWRSVCTMTKVAKMTKQRNVNEGNVIKASSAVKSADLTTPLCTTKERKI